jgi:2-polyprenyl-3-methyl-5-hydroxy-6-metoxy-1,4-benzoquinol methylase
MVTLKGKRWNIDSPNNNIRQQFINIHLRPFLVTEHPQMDYWDVIKGNIVAHREECVVYDFIHREIWNKSEQMRLLRVLKRVVQLIDNCRFSALDFGAGTGNVTKKLLGLGFKVNAVDISPEMCRFLLVHNKDDAATGKLTVFNVNVDVANTSGKYDLVTCYSVLHHLPDCIRTLKVLSGLTKKGGVLYVDHEVSPRFHTRIMALKRDIVARAFLWSYYFTNKILEYCYLRLHGIRVPNINYSKSDVGLSASWGRIVNILEEEGFSVELTEYYAHHSRFQTPLDILHRLILKSNTIMLIAKKDLC